MIYRVTFNADTRIGIELLLEEALGFPREHALRVATEGFYCDSENLADLLGVIDRTQRRLITRDPKQVMYSVQVMTRADREDVQSDVVFITSKGSRADASLRNSMRERAGMPESLRELLATLLDGDALTKKPN